MRRVIASVVLTLALSPMSLLAQWQSPAATAEKAIVTIGKDDTHCTGFIINDRAVSKDDDKREIDYVLTANHCDAPDLLADNMPAKVVYKDAKKDLLVLEVEDTGRPALRLAKKDPVIGDEVASYGYGFTLERPMFRVTHIADDKTYIPEGGIGGPFIVTDAVFVGGQSGGPVINQAGEVVMIVQRGGGGIGLGVGAEVIRSKAGKYFAKEVK
jgi:S1-C subfamily serine protease